MLGKRITLWSLGIALWGGPPVLAQTTQQYEYVRPTPPIPTLPSAPAPQIQPPPPVAPKPVVLPKAAVQPQVPNKPQPVVQPRPVRAWQPTPLQARGTVLLPAGARMPVRVYQSTLVTARYELPLTLEVTLDVIDSNGQLAIPKGSRIEGVFTPVFKEKQERQRSSYRMITKKILIGNYFQAQKLVIGARSYGINAVSYPFDLVPNPDLVGEDTNLKGAAYGFAGGMAATIATGGLALPLLLAGSAVGVATGGSPPATVVLEPDQPLTLELKEPLKGQPGA